MTLNSLAGLQVLDLSQWLPGRLCTSILSQYGALVTSVTSPSGDPMERFNPKLCGVLNKGKELVTVNLKHGLSDERTAALFGQSSVVIEGFRPGVMERFGLSYHTLSTLRKDILLCSLPGYRRDSALAPLAAHDLALEAFAGLLNGDMPEKPRVSTVDLIAGVLAVIATLGGLQQRRESGIGMHVEVPLADAAGFWSFWGQISASRDRGGGNDIFFGSDNRPFALCVLVDSEWEALWRLLDAIPESRSVTLEMPAKRGTQDTLHLLRACFSSKPRAFWIDQLSESGLVARPVHTPDSAWTDPYYEAMLVGDELWDLPVNLPFWLVK